MSNQPIDEILEEMRSRPLIEVANHLGKLMEDAGVDIPLDRMLQAVGTATLDALATLARDVGLLLKAAGADLDPDTYAGTHYGVAILKAQVQLYNDYMPDLPVEAEIVEPEGLGQA